MHSFWHGKRVLVTGHTGFKGSWLSLWLHQLGAEVHGYALPAPTNPALYEVAQIDELVHSTIADIRDGGMLARTMSRIQPEIVFHLAAQPLVRYSYQHPVETYETNVMGTVNLLEAVKATPSVKSVVVVTTDKCYENKEWLWGYRENDRLGGFDPYSNSKACAELVTSAYRQSFFNGEEQGKTAIASARAGNVIGGGDWAQDRLIPDILRAIDQGEAVHIRYPQATRPWQHVLSPLDGYMKLAEALYSHGTNFAEAWNFGPEDSDVCPVEKVISQLAHHYGETLKVTLNTESQLHEAGLLKLDSTKAKRRLGWSPKWSLNESIQRIVEWQNAWKRGENMRQVCLSQIQDYQG